MGYLLSVTTLTLLLLATITVSAKGVGTAGCFIQKTPTSERPIPIVFKSCHDAVKMMLPDMSLAQKPILFSRKENHGYQVPRKWQRGNCIIMIDMHHDEDEDILSFVDLATAAGMVNIVCVAKPPHYGGTVSVGPNRVMQVTLYGALSPQNPVLKVGRTPRIS